MKTTAKIDLAALKAAAERPDTSHAIVARRWLGDVYRALSGEADVELVPAGRAPAAGDMAAA